MINLGGTLNALSISPDGRKVVVAGREVLKIVNICDDKLEESANLRVGKVNLNFSSVDVKWNPLEQYKNMIATAATNGAVVIWNLGDHSANKQERIINDHTRTVNRISWHPEHGFTLLSGSQDGTMMLWDIRDPSSNRVVLDGKSESVRDVRFNPHNSNYFLAAFDNGFIQIWDIRKTSNFERMFTAHQGPVFCIDWHPEYRNLIASGGRDRFIQVWDLNAPRLKPIYSIQTVSSVSHIAWRPGYRDQVASSGLIDSKIQLWNLKRPFIPHASFVAHQDVVTDIDWLVSNSNTLLVSCGKDSTLCQQRLENAYRPLEHIRSVSLSWAPSGELAAIADRIERNCQDECVPTVEENRGYVYFCSANVSYHKKVHKQEPMSFNNFIYTYLAEHYRFHEIDKESQKETLDDNIHSRRFSFEYLCEHNSKEAAQMKQYQIAQIWLLLKLWFGKDRLPSSLNSKEYISPTLGFSIENSKSSSFGSSTTEYTVGNGRQVNLFFGNGMLSDEHSEDMDSKQAQQSQNQTTEEFQHCEGLLGSFSDPLQELLSSDVVSPITPLPLKVLERVGLPNPLQSRPSTPEPAPYRLEDAERDGMDSFSLLFMDELHWDPRPTVIDTLEFYAQNGDIQTSVIMALVLGDRINLDRRRLRQWILGYIDILNRLQLWCHANEIIKKSEDKMIRSMNQNSTTVHCSCPHCNKPLLRLGWVCENCKRSTNWCSICHETVRNLYTWCQVCGHGGHLSRISSMGLMCVV